MDMKLHDSSDQRSIEQLEEVDTPQMPRDSCSLIQMNDKFPPSLLLAKDEGPSENDLVHDIQNNALSKVGTNNSSPCNLKASQGTAKYQV